MTQYKTNLLINWDINHEMSQILAVDKSKSDIVTCIECTIPHNEYKKMMWYVCEWEIFHEGQNDEKACIACKIIST